jgi:translation initiation factor 2 alpha subunit (eIF-2alpha)
MKFYANRVPASGEIVAVRVDDINDYGVEVTLLEYDVKGMVMAAEVSRKRIRTVKEVLRIGQETAAQVTTANEETGCVDLSIKLCTPEEIAATLHQYHRHSVIFSMLNRLAEVTRTNVEAHLAALVWPRIAEDADVDIYDLFVSLNNPECDLDTVIPPTYPQKKELLEMVAAKLPTPTFTATQTVKMVCMNSLNAPELLTAALNAAAAVRGVSAWIIAPPEYKFSATGASQGEANGRLAEAIAAAKRLVGMPVAATAVAAKPIERNEVVCD